MQKCDNLNPVGTPVPGSDYTFTDNFNYDLARNVDLGHLYSLLGYKDFDEKISEQDCLRTDCLHPCFGWGRHGYCGNCFKTYVETGEGWDCSQCTLRYEGHY